MARRQRQHDRILGRRGLQLEIERAAEALAQREAPGAVDAAAERRMDDQLHAAGFVEEALHRELVSASATRRARPSRRRGSRRSGARRVRAKPSSSISHAVVSVSPSSSFAETSSRRRDTACDSSSLRPGASPSQNGIVGGAPCASSTRTRPRSTRRMRYDMLPSWKMSPARLSTAKSSLTVPIFVRLRLEHDVVVGRVGNRAARRERGQARAAARAQHAVDRVAMQIGARAGRRASNSLRRACARPRRNRRASASRTDTRRARASNSASSFHSRHATSATICCASTSSAFGIDMRAHRARRGAPHRAARRIRPARRATAGTGAPSACRRRRGPSGRRAAGTPRSSAASRSGRRDRRRRCRCRARATPSRRARAARRVSGAARRRGAAPCARLPWCAATASLPSRSLRCRAARSAMRRVLTKISVVWCWRDQRCELRVDLLPDVAGHDRFERRVRQFEREIALARRGRCRRSCNRR